MEGVNSKINSLAQASSPLSHFFVGLALLYFSLAIPLRIISAFIMNHFGQPQKNYFQLNLVRYFCTANFQYLIRSVLIFLFLIVWLAGFGQKDSILKTREDTPVKTRSLPPVRKPIPAPVKVLPIPVNDSLAIADSLQSKILVNDSAVIDSVVPALEVKKNAATPPKFTGIDSTYAHFLQNPYLPISGKPVFQILKFRVSETKDELFYLVAGLVLFLAFIKLLFSRYFINIFQLFFQPSFRQKQTR